MPWANTPDSPPHIVSLTMHLSVDDLVSLFEPSFKKIYDYLKLMADTASKKVSILFAGPLSVCPFLQNYIQSRISRNNDKMQILKTADGYIFPSLAAGKY